MSARTRFSVGLAVILHFLLVPDIHAHESRPAYLEISETGPGRYDLLWRTPRLSGQSLPVVLMLPAEVRTVTESLERELPDARVEHRLIEAAKGLAGQRIDFVGLQATLTDVLVRVQLHDGSYSTTLVHPSRPWIEIAPERGPLAVARTYLTYGIEHILSGFDHLLFVAALMLIVRHVRMLVMTVTAFTAAHSITLALATLRLVQVPGPPVEACIALSILILAGEIVRLQRGQPSLTARRPWVVAFCFGLLHGFGFAGALRDIGLPQGDVPLALFTFNLGVEFGQLAFITVFAGIIFVARRIAMPVLVGHRARSAAPYAIGVSAAFWFFERLAGFAT